MTAADELFRMLSGEIDDLPEDEDGGVIFHDPRMDRLDLDIFLSPRPDVLDESDPRMIEEIFYIPSVLGVYVPMHSPGQVKLHRARSVTSTGLCCAGSSPSCPISPATISRRHSTW